MFKFPWGDFHSLNLGWFLQKFNELREDWATAEAGIDGALDAEIQKAEDALTDVFAARDAAAASASAANSSARTASSSALNASQSSIASMDARDAARQAATNAAASETAAGNSATAASNSAGAAATSATQAGNSATAAGNSATAAAASETAAGNSASAAAASETAAGQSATNAAASAEAAAASAEGIITIQNPLMPNDFYGDDFTLVINGVTVTKKGNRINFKGRQTQPFTIRPFSSDHLATNEYIKPPLLNIAQNMPSEYKPSQIILESAFINNLQESSTTPSYVYSNIYTIVNGQDTFIIRQYLRANQAIPQNFSIWFMSAASIDENLINNGFCVDLFINCGVSEIDFDIIFNIRGSNASYLL